MLFCMMDILQDRSIKPKLLQSIGDIVETLYLSYL
jgi:hypothetical protein